MELHNREVCIKYYRKERAYFRWTKFPTIHTMITNGLARKWIEFYSRVTIQDPLTFLKYLLAGNRTGHFGVWAIRKTGFKTV